MIRSRYRALNTIMSLASGFTGFLDTYAGAVVAYSPNRLSSLYSSTMFRTRRSSDNTEDDIGFGSDNLLDTTALLAFVNADVNQYTSDFSSIKQLSEFNGTGAAAQSVGGVDDAYKFTLSGGNESHIAEKGNIYEYGMSYTVSFEYYIPSGQTITGLVAPIQSGNTGSTLLNVTGSWQSESIDIVVREDGVGNSNDRKMRFYAHNGTTITFDADDDLFYLKNIVVTQTDADGAVSVYEDQVDSTYNKETSDFSVGTNLYTSVSGFDTLTRLDDFEGVNNVLKLEATTAANTVHQMQKNIGQGDHFRYRVSCKIYIPTTNTGITKVALYNGVDIYRVIDKATEGDQWVTLENEEYFGSANTRFFVAGLNDAEDLSFASTTGDKFYLADVVIDGTYDLSNRTSDEQPLIVDGGTTETDNFFNFDGSNDRLVTKAIDAFQGDFTLDIKVEFTDVTTRQVLFANRTADDDKFAINLWNGNLYFNYYDGTNETGGRLGSVTIGTYTMTFVRSGSTYTLYVNGSEALLNAAGVGFTGSTGSGQMVLGDYRNAGSATNPFGGRVRTCIVYDSAQPEAHATAFNSLFS